MSEHDFGQRVMAAAGGAHNEDPLTPGGFCALWDALKKRGWLVFVGPEHAVVIGSGATYKASHWNRAQALLEAAAQTLGVSRG